MENDTVKTETIQVTCPACGAMFDEQVESQSERIAELEREIADAKWALEHSQFQWSNVSEMDDAQALAEFGRKDRYSAICARLGGT